MLTLTNKRINELAAVLNLYLSRGLPNSVARQRAQIWLSTLKPIHEGFNDALKPIQERERDALKLDADDPQRDAELASAIADYDALLAETHEIPEPKAKMQESDLPKPLKSNDGNHIGAGQIAVALAPEFFDLADPDGEKAEDE